MDRYANTLIWAILGAVVGGGLTLIFDLLESGIETITEANAGPGGATSAIIGATAGFIGGGIYGAFVKKRRG